MALKSLNIWFLLGGVDILLSIQFVIACDFPTYMQSNNTGRDWRASIKSQNTEFTLRIQVLGNQIKTISTDDTGTTHTRVCLQGLPNDKFLVAHEQSGQVSTRYTCIQFVKRSDTIIQIKEAPLSSSMGKNLCQNSNLQLNDWLIVDESKVHEGVQACPLNGGFSIQVFDQSIGRGVCDNGITGQTRMESECAMENGIYFYFRRQKCVPENLYMSFTQRTLCLANWQEGAYTFVLLRHDFEEYKKFMWVLRYPSSSGGSFIAVLIMDLVADMQPHIAATQNYLRLDVVRDTPRPAHSLCLDDFELCSVYSDPCKIPEMVLTCPRTCGVCHESRPTLCTFPQTFQAQWYNAAEPGTLAVTVNTTFMTTYTGQRQETLHCIQWDVEKPTANRNLHNQMLVKDFNNGCRPRFSCVQFMQKTSSVLFFKLSQELSWPFTKTGEDPIDCRYFSYDYDSHFTPNVFKTKYLNLVYLRASNSVTCDIPSDIENYEVLFKNQTRCSAASLNVNEDTGKAFTLQLPNDCPMRGIETGYVCVDSSRMLPRRDQLVVTRSVSNADLIQCWVFPKRKPDLFYLLSAKDCNEAVRKRLNKDRLRYLAVFSRTGVFPSITEDSSNTPITEESEPTIVVTPRNKKPRQPPSTGENKPLDKSTDSTDVSLNDDYRVFDNEIAGDNITNVQGGGNGDGNEFEITTTSVVVVGVVFTFAVIQTLCICKS